MLALMGLAIKIFLDEILEDDEDLDEIILKEVKAERRWKEYKKKWGGESDNG